MPHDNRNSGTPRGSENNSVSNINNNSSRVTQTSSQDHSSATAGDTPPDLAVFVQDLLEQMQTRFSEMGDSITGKMDEMGKRMDELEQSINDLMDQAGLEPPPGVATGRNLDAKKTKSNQDTSRLSEGSESRTVL